MFFFTVKHAACLFRQLLSKTSLLLADVHSFKLTFFYFFFCHDKSRFLCKYNMRRNKKKNQIDSNRIIWFTIRSIDDLIRRKKKWMMMMSKLDFVSFSFQLFREEKNFFFSQVNAMCVWHLIISGWKSILIKF